MTRDGSYVQAKDLTAGTSLMRCNACSRENRGVDYKVDSVVPGERYDLYNIQVESEFHNYPLADLGVMVSNCSLEIRVAAIISGDKHYREMLQAGTDFHKATAALVFNVPIDEVTKEQRQNAKAVNFG